MSLILDALRKMELERKAKRQSSVELRAEVLNYRGNAQPPQKSRLLPVIAALLVFSSAVALFLYFKGVGAKPSLSVKEAASPTVATPTHLAAPLAPVSPLVPPQTVKPTAVNRAFPGEATQAKLDELPQAPGDNTIVISGIAWQEERSLRRAVINGALVGEDAEVIGAKVVEIRQNLVRFSREGRIFEVIYSSGSGR